MNIDYVYVYPKNWDGCRDNIICQQIKRGEKYCLNPLAPVEKNDLKKIETMDILIEEEEDEEQKAWLKRKQRILLLRSRREC